MIVITRNGQTRVYTGWREWALLAVGLILSWIVLAAIVVLILGMAATVAVMLLLVLPAMIVVALVRGLLRS